MTTAIQWNPELDAELRHLRVELGLPWGPVAKKMNFCRATCQLRGIALGFPPVTIRRKAVPFNTAVDATILSMRAAGATFREIAAATGIDLSSVWNRHRELTRSVAGRAPVASEVQQGLDGRAAGFISAAMPVSDCFLPKQTDGAPSRAPSSFGGDD